MIAAVSRDHPAIVNIMRIHLMVEFDLLVKDTFGSVAAVGAA